MTKSFFLFLLVSIAQPGCSQSGPAISISHLQVVAPAPGRTPGVAYMTISNKGRSAVELVAVSSSQFARVEMHQTVLRDGVARMQALSSVTIDAKSSVAFEPGGRHMMLFQPTEGLIPGAEISLRFQFASGEMLMITTPLATRIPVN